MLARRICRPHGGRVAGVEAVLLRALPQALAGMAMSDDATRVVGL
jgi:hypothetical protein